MYKYYDEQIKHEHHAFWVKNNNKQGREGEKKLNLKSSKAGTRMTAWSMNGARKLLISVSFYRTQRREKKNLVTTAELTNKQQLILTTRWKGGGCVKKMNGYR